MVTSLTWVSRRRWRQWRAWRRCCCFHRCELTWARAILKHDDKISPINFHLTPPSPQQLFLCSKPSVHSQCESKNVTTSPLATEKPRRRARMRPSRFFPRTMRVFVKFFAMYSSSGAIKWSISTEMTSQIITISAVCLPLLNYGSRSSRRREWFLWGVRVAIDRWRCVRFEGGPSTLRCGRWWRHWSLGADCWEGSAPRRTCNKHTDQSSWFYVCVFFVLLWRHTHSGSLTSGRDRWSEMSWLAYSLKALCCQPSSYFFRSTFDSFSFSMLTARPFSPNSKTHLHSSYVLVSNEINATLTEFVLLCLISQF